MRRAIEKFVEFVGWLPLQVVLTFAAVIVFGALSRGLGPDLLAWLAELPVHLAYAFAALGVAYIAWRKWRFHLSDDQKQDLWRGIMNGRRGALFVYVVNAIFYIGVLWISFWFFYPAR